MRGAPWQWLPVWLPWLLWSPGVPTTPAWAVEASWSGSQIMAESRQSQGQANNVYEEQTLVLLDESGYRRVHSLRYHYRTDPDGSDHWLIVLDQPEELRGTAWLAQREKGEEPQHLLYLPGLEKKFQPLAKESNDPSFLGSDFATEDLMVEMPDHFRYERRPDQEMEKIPYHVVDAFPVNESVRMTSQYDRRRHFIRQDLLVIARTDYFARGGHLLKRRTCHDWKQINGKWWRAGTILMDRPGEHHKSLIKVDRRIFSPNHVPAELFTRSFLAANRHRYPVKPSTATAMTPEAFTLSTPGR